VSEEALYAVLAPLLKIFIPSQFKLERSETLAKLEEELELISHYSRLLGRSINEVEV